MAVASIPAVHIHTASRSSAAHLKFFRYVFIGIKIGQ